MKRSAPLQRRTPLKAKTPLKRSNKPLAVRRPLQRGTTPLRPRSKKMAAKIRKLIPMYEEFLAQPAHECCEYPDGCSRRSAVVHHRRGRTGELLLDTLFWAGSCHEHNQAAEDDTGTCLANGWLLPQFGLLPDELEDDAA